MKIFVKVFKVLVFKLVVIFLDWMIILVKVLEVVVWEVGVVDLVIVLVVNDVCLEVLEVIVLVL